MRLLAFAQTFAIAAALAAPAAGQTGRNVLVVINQDSPASVTIGEYYADRRAVPAPNVVRITTTISESIERDDYLRTIESPVAQWIARQGLQDDVWYIVLTKGVPLRISGTTDREGTLASVDSELALLYRKLVGDIPPLVGRVENPYFLGDRPVTEAGRFTRSAQDVYLVTRLDGFSVEDANGLVDRALAATTTGTVVLDERALPGDRGADGWLDEAARRLTMDRDDIPVLHEITRAVAATTDRVVGYYSWGSNDPAHERRGSGLTFAPGAIGAMFLSSDGRTFVEPPADWQPADPSTGRGRLFYGSFQSLAGDLVREGITGVAAQVAEPFLDATIRPHVLFPAYVAGFNLAESFYLAMPFLSWRTVVLGDPLAGPFTGPAIANDELLSPIDPATELPAHFSARRFARVARDERHPDAVRLLLKAESRLARDDHADVEPLLVEATRLDPALIPAQVRLAGMYEERKDYARAIERYRAVIEADVDHVLALNNLAYLLAEHHGMPEEALSFARRAYRLSRIPTVVDTLGWVHHLLGEDDEALPLVAGAAAAAPGDVAILLHLAAVHAALGDRPSATTALDAARALDSTVSNRPDVRALEDRVALLPARPRPRTRN